MSSSPAQFRSLLDGELDVALTSPDNVLAYRFDPGNPLGQVADVRIVSAIDRGMGLGLWIVRQIVDAHLGTIHVASELGKGARFRVQLPMERDLSA